MSDFFTRLAERTLGQALTIQPFKPSLFAPGPDAASEVPFEPPVGADLSRPSPIYRPGTERPVLHPAFAQTPAHAHNPEASGAVEALLPARDEGLTPTRLSVNGTLSQANLHQSSEQNRRHTPTAEAFSPQHILPPLIGAIELAAQQSNLNAQHTVRSQTHPSSYDESSSSQRAESVNLLVGAGEASGGDGAHHPPDGVLVSARWGGRATRNVGTGGGWVEGGGLVPVRRADRNVGTPLVGVRSDGLVPSACLAPPTIQVTIGRVEVRAVTAPATTTHSQQQPVKPPAMSLDEYLRRQEQGGRR